MSHIIYRNGALTAPYRCKRHATNVRIQHNFYEKKISNEQRINKHRKNRFNIYISCLCIVLLFSNNSKNNNIDDDDGSNNDIVSLSITAWLGGVCTIFICSEWVSERASEREKGIIIIKATTHCKSGLFYIFEAQCFPFSKENVGLLHCAAMYWNAQ